MFIFYFLKRRWFDLTTWNAGVFLTGADMLSDQSNETRESCQFHHFLFGSQPGRKTNSNKPMEGGLTVRSVTGKGGRAIQKITNWVCFSFRGDLMIFHMQHFLQLFWLGCVCVLYYFLGADSILDGIV